MGKRPVRDHPDYQSRYEAPDLFDLAEAGDAAALRARLDAGAWPDHEDDIGYNALMMAAQLGRLECLRVLLEGGAAADQSMHAAPHLGLTAIACAANAGHADCVAALAAAGADVDAQMFEDAE
jgi:ankyrin repeat protein